MIRTLRLLGALAVAAVCLTPSMARAQTSSIAGLVTDTSGAVLPGVTVEASSPALIEGTRTATTDGSGRYNITELRPGVYTVTFTLTGFTPIHLIHSRMTWINVARAGARSVGLSRG